MFFVLKAGVPVDLRHVLENQGKAPSPEALSRFTVITIMNTVPSLPSRKESVQPTDEQMIEPGPRRFWVDAQHATHSDHSHGSIELSLNLVEESP